MVDLSKDGRQLLTELFNRTGGDTAATVSMFEVGETAGLSRERSGAAGEELIGWGLVEVRTLSGGIALAQSGVAEADRITGGKEADASVFRLGSEVVIEEKGRAAVDRLVSRLKVEAETYGLGFEALAELIADLKTIDVQLSSPRPKAAVIRESFRSVLFILSAADASGPEADVRRILGES